MQQYVLHEDGVGEAHFARRIDNSCVNAPTWIGQEPVSSLVPKAIVYVVAESSNHRVMKWSQWVKGDVVQSCNGKGRQAHWELVISRGDLQIYPELIIKFTI